MHIGQNAVLSQSRHEAEGLKQAELTTKVLFLHSHRCPVRHGIVQFVPNIFLISSPSSFLLSSNCPICDSKDFSLDPFLLVGKRWK